MRGKMGLKAKKRAHVLVVPYPRQGHINPMLQFSRSLASKGVKVTLVITKYLFKTLNPTPDGHITLATISDGHDEGRCELTVSIDTYLFNFKSVGSQTLGDLIEAYAITSHPVTCIIYDSLLPWTFDVASKYNVTGAPFFTQSCVVNYIFFSIYHGKLSVPISSLPVEISGVQPLGVDDLPSFVGLPGSYPMHLNWHISQISNLDKAKFVLINSFYELEDKVVKAMSKECALLPIGPIVPSLSLDSRNGRDKGYGLNLYDLDKTTDVNHWLSTKSPRSVVYVSFGSMACVSSTQMEELAFGLRASGCNFLWVVRASEESKLPRNFAEEARGNALLVRWCPQLEVLASEAIGCFFTHCGWNSILEALSLGVPMIGMPQWVDQPTNAMLIQDVWKVGVRVKVDTNGVVTREEIANRIKEVMVGKRSDKIRYNAKRWKDLTKSVLSQGGSSNKNINDFIAQIECSKLE